MTKDEKQSGHLSDHTVCYYKMNLCKTYKNTLKQRFSTVSKHKTPTVIWSHHKTRCVFTPQKINYNRNQNVYDSQSI